MRRLSLYLALLFFFSCDSGEDKITIGRVVDSSGVPVNEAEIHIYYSEFRSELDGDKLDLTINFDLAEVDRVRVNVRRFGTNEFLFSAFNGVLAAGSHTIVIDEAQMTNGTYLIELESETVNRELEVLIHRTEFNELIGVIPLIATNDQGTFELDNDIFSIGSQVDGLVMPAIIEFVAIKANRVIGSEAVTINPDSKNELTISVNNP